MLVSRRRAGGVVAALSLVASAACVSAPPAQAAARICDEVRTIYSFSEVTRNRRPTSVKSAYITGPGTISYNKTISTSVGFTASASVSAEAGVVFAKASATAGVALTTQRSWTDGFTYTLSVPSGQRRAMQLFQESRSFKTTKKILQSPCYDKTVYSRQTANAPRKTRVDEWRLVG